MDRPLPDDATPLFRVPPERFTSARNALADELKADGRTEDAAAVRAIRKPTLLIWALNHLANQDGGSVAALLDAGRELRAAQQAAASTAGGGDRLREATLARRTVVASLVATAVAALDDAGRAGAVQREQVASALETASIDQGGGERLSSGTLESAPSAPGGFGDVFGLASVPTGPETSEEAAKPSVSELKNELTRLRRERARVAKATDRQREAADHLSEQLEELGRRRAKIATDHAEVVARVGQLQLDVKRLDREIAQATDTLEERGRSDPDGTRAR
jgi:hypothetical protein